jgi:hypothetical protein
MLLCIVLSLSFLLSIAWATDLDEDELPGIVIGPVQPKRTLIVSAPNSWGEVYAYTWEPESFNRFPGTMLTKQGNVFRMEILGNMENLILSTPNPEGGHRQTAEILLESNDQEVAVMIAENGGVQVCYGTVGDVTRDGKLNIGDPGRLYSHLKGSNSLSDPAALLFADMTGDGRVNLGDVAKLYALIRA